MNGVTVYADFRKNQKPIIKPAGEAVKPGTVEIIMQPLSDVSFFDRFELVLWPKGGLGAPYAVTLKPGKNGFSASVWLNSGEYGIDIEGYQTDDLRGKSSLRAACCNGSLEVK